MSCGKMPLFPQPFCGQSSLHMPLFDGKNCDCDCWTPTLACEDCQCVRIQNPACPGEFADVELCVDCNGNLSICVRRSNRPNCGHALCNHPNCNPLRCKPSHCDCDPCARKLRPHPGPWMR